MASASEPSDRFFRVRSPLFLTALLFAAGCATGYLTSDPLTKSWWIPAACFIGTLLGWIVVTVATRDPRLVGGVLSALCFTSCVFCAGWWQAQIPRVWCSPQDIRLLTPRLTQSWPQWTGWIHTSPERHGGWDQCECELETVRDSSEMTHSPRPVRGRFLLRIRVEDRLSAPVWCLGQRIQFSGIPEQPPLPLVPGQLDFRHFLSLHGIYFIVQAERDSVHLLGQAPEATLFSLAARARNWARQQLTRGLEQETVVTALLCGMLFGDVATMPPEIASAFRNTGTYHIFSVSGQNVAVLLGVGLFLLSLIRIQRWQWGWLLAPFLVFYTLLSGAQPSVIRALLLSLLVLSLWKMGRPLAPLHLWGFCLLLLLFFAPETIVDLGVLLSFSVVLSLLLLSRPFFRLFSAPFEPDPFVIQRLIPRSQRVFSAAGRGVAALLSASCAAWLGSLPVSVLCFHQLSPVGILANLWVVPLAELVVIIGTLGLFVAPVWPALTLIVNNANWLLVKLLLGGVLFAAKIPGGYFAISDPSLWLRPATPRFVVVPVSTGQALLVDYRGVQSLIYAGSELDIKGRIRPLALFYGINRWQAIVLPPLTPVSTQGLKTLLSLSPANVLYCTSGDGKSLTAPCPITPLASGMPLRLNSDLFCTLLSPSDSVSKESGFLCRFEWKSHCLLYASKVGFGQEAVYLRSGQPLAAEALIQSASPHEPSFSAAWLQAISPQELIFSSLQFHSRLSSPSELSPLSSLIPRVWDQHRFGACTLQMTGASITVTPWQP